MKRVVSAWLPDWPVTVWMRPTASPSTTRPSPPDGAPFALIEKGVHGLALHALNLPARAAGLWRGQAHADACAMLPGLVSAPAEQDRDLLALKRLAPWAERFSPSVAIDTLIPGFEGLFLDMTGGAHLFGGEAAMLADLRGRLARAGIEAHVAMADTPAAAWALARFSGETEVVAPAGGLREALARLPVESLRLEPKALTLLKRFGLKTIGDLYGLPRAGLARRFRGEIGFRVVERLDQALGILPEPLDPERPAPCYRVWTPFAEPVIDMAGVGHHLPGLAEALCGQLSRDGRGARRLRLTGFRVDGRVTLIEAGLSAPAATPAHLMRLLREKGLEKLDLGFGIDALMLSAEKAEALEARQGEMDESVGPAPTHALAALIDRLQARLGEPAVRRPRFTESWIPERGEAWAPAGPEPPPAPERDEARLRPILLFEPPEPVQTLAELPDGVPARFIWRRASRRVVKAEGPERLGAEWWAGPQDRPHRTRDYYRVEDDNGRRYWLYREGLYGREDADRGPTWWIAGVFA
jgi:protein ImuB